MSRIYFHSLSATAELRGSERAHMKITLDDLALAMLGVGQDLGSEPVFDFSHLRRWEYEGVGSKARLRRDFDLWMRTVSGSDCVTLASGEPADVFSLVLNTGLALGGDPVRLMARLHGQCEIHAWVAGENRAWLAGIIEEGRACGVLRDGQGWEAVAGMLRSRDDETVVTSYSVSDSFPSAHMAGITDDNDADAWYDMPDAEQWASALKGLEPALELSPGRWKFPDYYFEHGETAFSLLAGWHKESVRESVV